MEKVEREVAAGWWDYVSGVAEAILLAVASFAPVIFVIVVMV